MVASQSQNIASPQQKPGEWTPGLTEDFLDATTFEQLLEMDDDDEREFSKGRNGSGKSTLLRTIAGVIKPAKGKITVKGSFAPIEEGM